MDKSSQNNYIKKIYVCSYRNFKPSIITKGLKKLFYIFTVA